jgi:hypothetical protein
MVESSASAAVGFGLHETVAVHLVVVALRCGTGTWEEAGTDGGLDSDEHSGRVGPS